MFLYILLYTVASTSKISYVCLWVICVELKLVVSFIYNKTILVNNTQDDVNIAVKLTPTTCMLIKQT